MNKTKACHAPYFILLTSSFILVCHTEAAGVEPAKPVSRLPGFRDRSPRQWGQSFLRRARQESNLWLSQGCGLAAGPPASCSRSQWVRQDSNLRSPEAPDLQSGAIAAPPHTRIASYGTRTRSGSVTSCYAHPYTNEAGVRLLFFKGERGNRTLATTFTVSGAATTPNSPSVSQRKRRDSNPQGRSGPRV